MPSALVLVENNSVPTDSRVWAICLSLRRAGWDVTAISPAGRDRDSEPFVVIDGVRIHRFALSESVSGGLGYAREYGLALFRIATLVRQLSRRERFDVVHACNPPDFLLLAALPLRRRGTATIFDHHDLSPELYRAKYRPRAAVDRALRLAERGGFGMADVVLATNESFREIATTRGRKSPDDVFVVRNGPGPDRGHTIGPDLDLRAKADHLIGYVGLMGSQDGIEVAVEALAELRRRRTDWHAVFVGDGPALPSARRLASSLGLDGLVSFLGFVRDRDRLGQLIASCDVCLSPEPRNPMNERSTFIKVAEYMAAGKPVVAFDLTETRRTAGDAARYATRDDPAAFADAIDAVLGDDELRREMGAEGVRRVRTSLSWTYSERSLLEAYARALRKAGTSRPRGAGQGAAGYGRP